MDSAVNSFAPRKNACCSYCGKRFVAGQAWPRTCGCCGQTSYLNPIPVAVALVPVDGGLLCIRRSIEPACGELALPGGFMEVGETWQEAVARELWEEAGVRLPPHELELFGVHTSRDDPFLVIFGLAGEKKERDLSPYVPNSETSERVVLHGPAELAFPLHTRALREFFERRKRP